MLYMKKITKLKIISSLLTCFIFCSLAQGQNWTQLNKIVAKDRDTNDYFGGGGGVSISGNYAIVGSNSGTDVNGLNYIKNSGAVYFFKLVGGNWVQQQKLVPLDRQEEVFTFFSDVSISGNYAIAGAWCKKSLVSGPDSGNIMGAAYIFERDTISDTWAQKQEIVQTNLDGESDIGFGAAVSISGNYAIVGRAPWSGSSGAAYIFERDGSGNWVQSQKIISSDVMYDDNFGWDVSISGNDALIGAYHEYDNYDDGVVDGTNNPGAAYHFERVAGVWVEKQKLVTSRDSTLEHALGCSVSISGNYLILGSRSPTDTNWTNPIQWAGAAYIFERTGQGAPWLLKQKMVDPNRDSWEFGSSVCISGERAIVGEYRCRTDVNNADSMKRAGAAFIFERDAVTGNWLNMQKIVPTVRDSFDFFGNQVSISEDYAIIGSYNSTDSIGANFLNNAGSAYVFAAKGFSYTPTCFNLPMPFKSSGTATTYKWHFGNPSSGAADSSSIKDPTHTYALAGTYTVTLITSGGSSGNDTITKPVTVLSSLPINIGPSNITVCQGTALILDAGNFTSAVYAWSPNSETSQTIHVPSSGTYSVSVTSGACTGHDLIGVTFVPSPTLVVTPNTTICSGTSINLTVTGAVSYNWSPVTGLSSKTGSNVTANPTINVTYMITGTNGGCGASTTVKIAVNSSPSLTVSSNVTICMGTSANLSAAGATSYSWSPATGLSATIGNVVSASPLVTTSYSVTGMNSDCNNITATTVKVMPLPIVAILVSGYTLTASSTTAISYQWELNGSDITGATNNVYIASATGNYSVKVTDANGCFQTSNTQTVTITGINESEMEKNINIFPNPVTNSINISLPDLLLNNHSLLFNIYDLTGKEIMSEMFSDAKSQDVITINNPLADGMYLYKITISSGQTGSSILNKRGTLIVLR